MKFDEFRNELRKDPEYIEAEKHLELILNLADEVLKLRIEKGWSQSELARRVGTKQSNISRIESGLGKPTIDFLQRLADAFETKLTIHLGGILKIFGDVINTRTEAHNQKPIRVLNWPQSNSVSSTENYYTSTSTDRKTL
jgi:transcriptional regulator with XRE-family HTH domain